MPAKFGRVVTAMATPFKDDLAVDYDKAAELANRLVSNGSDGVVVSGTTGESPTLTVDEKLTLFKVVLDAVGNRAHVIAGTGSYNTAESIRLTKEAEKLGVHGALAVVPYYNKPPQEGMYRHFSAIAASTGLPLMLYNIPSRCGVNMLPETVARLAAIPNIVAVKESSGMMDQISEMVRLTGPDFDIYSGDDYATLPTLAMGGVGIVSVAAHLAGTRIRAMVQAFFAGDVATATRIHLELMPLFKGLFFTANPIPLKAALRLTGFDIGSTRPPLPPATASDDATVQAMLRAVALN